jgi:hypothetical protein
LGLFGIAISEEFLRKCRKLPGSYARVGARVRECASARRAVRLVLDEIKRKTFACRDLRLMPCIARDVLSILLRYCAFFRDL